MIYEQVPKYPHMLPDEAAIWHRFYVPRARQFLRVDYDIHVGEGVLPPSGLPDWIRAVVEATSKKRIDAVAESSREIWIIEVKPRGGMSAVGQLLAYEILYQGQFKPVKPLKKVLVAERMAPDLDLVFAQYDIEVYLV